MNDGTRWPIAFDGLGSTYYGVTHHGCCQSIYGDEVKVKRIAQPTPITSDGDFQQLRTPIAKRLQYRHLYIYERHPMGA
jgi:hypothetical protein